MERPPYNDMDIDHHHHLSSWLNICFRASSIYKHRILLMASTWSSINTSPCPCSVHVTVKVVRGTPDRPHYGLLSMCILCLAWKGRNSFSVIEVLLLSHWPMDSNAQLNMDVLGRSIYLCWQQYAYTLYFYQMPWSKSVWNTLLVGDCTAFQRLLCFAPTFPLVLPFKCPVCSSQTNRC